MLTIVSREAALGMRARNASLNSIKPSPSKVVPVGEVLQGQLVEGVDHGVDLLPLGARGLGPLLGGGLVQHALRGGGLHGDLWLHVALDPLATRIGLVVGLLFVNLRIVVIHHGHGEPSEMLANSVPIPRGYGGPVAVRIIVVGVRIVRGRRGGPALSLQSVEKTHATNFIFTIGSGACFRGSFPGF